MQFTLKSLLLLQFAFLPLFISFIVLDSSSGLQVLLRLAFPATIYAAVFSLIFSTSYRKLTVFRRVGSVGIGAIAGFAFFVLATTPLLIRGYVTEYTRAYEIFGAMAEFILFGTVLGASCGVVVGRLVQTDAAK